MLSSRQWQDIRRAARTSRDMGVTLVVHGVKVTAEWLAVSGYYERYRAALGGGAALRVGADAGAAAEWSRPLRPYTREAKVAFFRLLNVPVPD